MELQRNWMAEINAMHGEMERWLDYVSGRKPPAVHFAPGGWAPSVDIYETPDEVVVLVELAGIKQEDIEITAEGNRLLLRGERQDINPGGKRSYHQMEIQWGHFQTVVLLPSPIDPDRSRASYQDGMLEVVLPKSVEAKTQRVKLKKT